MPCELPHEMPPDMSHAMPHELLDEMPISRARNDRRGTKASTDAPALNPSGGDWQPLDGVENYESVGAGRQHFHRGWSIEVERAEADGSVVDWR